MVITHPFHPLSGQRVAVLLERGRASGRVLVCDGGPLGTVTVPWAATDRAAEPAERPLTYEVLVALGEAVAAIRAAGG